jgi:hypothetical protein
VSDAARDFARDRARADRRLSPAERWMYVNVIAEQVDVDTRVAVIPRMILAAEFNRSESVASNVVDKLVSLELVVQHRRERAAGRYALVGFTPADTCAAIAAGTWEMPRRRARARG